MSNIGKIDDIDVEPLRAPIAMSIIYDIERKISNVMNDDDVTFVNEKIETLKEILGSQSNDVFVTGENPNFSLEPSFHDEFEYELLMTIGASELGISINGSDPFSDLDRVMQMLDEGNVELYLRVTE